MAKKNIFQNLYAIKSYVSAYQSSIRGYNLAYDCMPKHTGGIISRGGYIFDCYTGTCSILSHAICIKASNLPSSCAHMCCQFKSVHLTEDLRCESDSIGQELTKICTKEYLTLLRASKYNLLLQKLPKNYDLNQHKPLYT